VEEDVQAGVVSSSNNLGYSEQDWKQIEENDTSVKEMEGAAIAWAAHLFDAPLLALKSVTDIVDGERPPQEEFLENLQQAAHALKVTFHPISCFLGFLLHTLSTAYLPPRCPLAWPGHRSADRASDPSARDHRRHLHDLFNGGQSCSMEVNLVFKDSTDMLQK
jgi:hypothetical protein